MGDGDRLGTVRLRGSLGTGLCWSVAFADGSAFFLAADFRARGGPPPSRSPDPVVAPRRSLGHALLASRREIC